MCLNRLLPSNKTFKITKENGNNVGWKLFKKRRKRLIPGVRYSIKPYYIGVWYKEEEFRICQSITQIIIYSHSRKTYPPGFHIYLTEPTCFYKFEKRKVYFRNIVAQGYEGDKSRTIVAKEMYIVPKRKEKNEQNYK